jgi:hypothetical protein
VENGLGHNVGRMQSDGVFPSEYDVVVVAHHAVGDELAKVGLGKVVEQLGKFIAVRWVVGERVMVGFGSGNFAEDVVSRHLRIRLWRGDLGAWWVKEMWLEMGLYVPFSIYFQFRYSVQFKYATHFFKDGEFLPDSTRIK